MGLVIMFFFCQFLFISNAFLLISAVISCFSISSSCSVPYDYVLNSRSITVIIQLNIGYCYITAYVYAAQDFIEIVKNAV